MHLQDHPQIIGKIDGTGKMTCWKIIQKAGPNVIVAFFQIVHPPEEDHMLVFKSVRASAGQQNQTKLHLQMFKENKSAPDKLPLSKESL